MAVNECKELRSDVRIFAQAAASATPHPGTIQPVAVGASGRHLLIAAQPEGSLFDGQGNVLAVRFPNLCAAFGPHHI